jgi:hypothetical protein
MVKLAHDLTDGGTYARPELPLDGTIIPTRQRAA